MAGFKSILILFHLPLGILLFLLMKTTPAEASLHPTKPNRNTTYIAGQAALVTWAEDGNKPLLASLGRMKIDLYAGHNTLLATVAKDIDPLALSTTIFIPSAIPVHYHHFNLCFKATSPATSSVVLTRPLPRPRLHAPSTVVYTADFSITPNPLSVQSIFPPHSSTSGNTTSSALVHSKTLSTLIPSSPASRLVPSATAGTAEKGKSGAVGRGLKARGGMQGAGVMWMRIFTRLAGSIHIPGWDSEEIKFRLAFIVCPALIGILMAV